MALRYALTIGHCFVIVARTAVQKKTRPLIATGAKTTAKAGGRGRRKRVVKLESSSSEESESEKYV